MKTIFYSIVSDDYYEGIGTPKLLASFKKFHPDIEFKIVTGEDQKELFKNNPWMNWENAKPTIGKILSESYDLVVCMDSDCIITGTLTKILEGNYDIGGVLNNNEFDPQIMVGDVSFEKYLNAGLVASTSKKFWYLWESLNKMSADTLPFHEQDTLNFIFWNYPWNKIKVFDYGNDPYYGTKSRGKWSDIYIEDDRLMIDGIEVKIIHEAGGHSLPKLQFDNWNLNSEVLERLKVLIYE